MTIAFTVCSNNFLAQAKTLSGSLLHYNPGIKHFIFLADEKQVSVDYDFFAPAEIIVVNENIVPGFQELVGKYNLIELNSDLKPFLFEYLVGNYPEATRLLYLDSDTCVYDRFDHLDVVMKDSDIVITPHFCTPLPDDGLEPFENIALNFGTYNLGFLAINPKTSNTRRFLKWWSDRTRKFGFQDAGNGYFVDQLWFNLVPVFFEKVHTLKHPGYNMAPWNLHERTIAHKNDDGKIMLQSGETLVFYHFSSYDYFRPELISWKYNRYDFSNLPGLRKLYDDYRLSLAKNKIGEFSKIKCGLQVKKKPQPGPVKRLLYPGVNLLRKIWNKM